MHTGQDFFYLPDDVLDGMRIAPAEIADEIERALVAKSEGRLHTAPKSAIMPGDGRYMMSTMAVGDDGLTVVKQVSVSPENPARGLPAINGAIMVLDAETGLLRALLGANWITAHRTAALSAVAARKLADPASETIAFVGCGVQADSHLQAFRDMFPLSRVLAVGRGAKNVQRFCASARDLGYEAIAAEPKDALRQADIVVTSITLDYTVKPFLDARWLKPNAFAAITDLFIPWDDTAIDIFGMVVVDDLEQERAMDKPMVPAQAISGDLADLVMGALPARSLDAPAAFAFRGIALGDYAASALALRHAEASGAGEKIAP
ncbi:MAG: ornithine cyclodeaminase family protein [Silicimonas sp.]|nr:ornithine cyclodeaminase family protein [Silicimonas sp.]